MRRLAWQIDETERAIGNAAQHFKGVALPDADVGQVPLTDMAERGGDAVDEGFAADEGMIGQKIGAIGEMLARTEADFEMQRPILAEQRDCRNLTLVRHFDLRK
jgi:hypothetical protein